MTSLLWVFLLKVRAVLNVVQPVLSDVLSLHAGDFFIVAIKKLKKARQNWMKNVTLSAKPMKDFFLQKINKWKKSLILDVCWLPSLQTLRLQTVIRGNRAAHGSTHWSNAEVFTLLSLLTDKTKASYINSWNKLKPSNSLFLKNYMNFNFLFPDRILPWVTADLFSYTFPVPQHDMNKAERVRMQIEVPNLCINSYIINLTVLGRQIFGRNQKCIKWLEKLNKMLGIFYAIRMKR